MTDTVGHQPIKVRIRRLRKGQITKIFRSYGAYIGYLAISWNRLHANLAQIFEHAIHSQNHKMGGSIWYSTDSDYQQRKMLRAAIARARHLSPEQRTAIEWVLNKIDETLRHNRNNALHAPLFLLTNMSKAAKTVAVPDTDSGSPRANALRGKDLRDEFKQYIALSKVLSLYTSNMARHFRWPERVPWPEKPALPHANQKKSRKGSSRRSSAKRSSRQPRSSLA